MESFPSKKWKYQYSLPIDCNRVEFAREKKPRKMASGGGLFIIGDASLGYLFPGTLQQAIAETNTRGRRRRGRLELNSVALPHPSRGGRRERKYERYQGRGLGRYGQQTATG